MIPGLCARDGSTLRRPAAEGKIVMCAANAGSVFAPPGPVLLLGVPGAGKGTQARRLSSRFDVPHISTGDMFRDLAGDASPLGRRMREYMQGGGLVPDDLVCELVAERLNQPDCQRGFILDGFPRTIPQAEWLEGYFRSRAGGRSGRECVVIYLTVGYNDLYRRLSGRRTCSVCGRIYNVLTQPPRQAGICDEDRSPLIQRKDDDPDVIRERLEAYEAWTLPLVDYFRRSGRLHEIRGTDPVDRVSRAIDAVIDASIPVAMDPIRGAKRKTARDPKSDATSGLEERQNEE